MNFVGGATTPWQLRGPSAVGVRNADHPVAASTYPTPRMTARLRLEDTLPGRGA